MRQPEFPLEPDLAAELDAIDATLAGRIVDPEFAELAELTVMVAGAPEHIAIAQPLLELLGSRIFVVGERPGQGQAVKVINNLMSACSLAITAEATSLGVKAGVDPATLLKVVAASSGSNTAAAQKFPAYVLTRTFHQGFRREDQSGRLEARTAVTVGGVRAKLRSEASSHWPSMLS